MKQEKLDALYTLATDERTPEEERRTSAVLYLKHAPRWKEPTKDELLKVFTKDIARKVLSEEITEYERKATELSAALEKVKKQALKTETDLCELKDAIRAAREANTKVAKLIDEPAKEQKYKSPFTDPFASQIGEIFYRQNKNHF